MSIGMPSLPPPAAEHAPGAGAPPLARPPSVTPRVAASCGLRLHVPLAPPAILRHLAAALSKTVVTLMLTLVASPPPASFFRQGCLPLAIRCSAWAPAGVGPTHCRIRLRARLLPHAPQREQKAKGASPSTSAMLCPFSPQARAFLWAMCPWHWLVFCLAVRASATAHVPQHSHRHVPWL